ncbi:hypothetical protein VPH35_057535 [Triticum aestivum]|uniref:Uncharacterized protein n=1 Tax=Aegilops tauschii subsp. strangulata TaxID=200361 RepID=A0A453DTE4_AEGTS|nr:uncharacterized protein LOC123073782 [Triticum aestivum]
MQPAQPPCGSRGGGRGAQAGAAALPRCNHHRLLVLVVIMYLVGGSDVLLLAAAAAPARRLGVAESVAYDVGSRPVPEVVAAASSPSSTPAAVGLTDNKRPVPSCPDALHNR